MPLYIFCNSEHSLNSSIIPDKTTEKTTFTKPLHLIHTELTHKLYSIIRRARYKQKHQTKTLGGIKK